MQQTDGFIPDGNDRLRDNYEPQIRAEIELKYAEQLTSASWFGRRKIRKQIEYEVAQQLNDLAPPEALF